jgi:VIT1/CCC1 family predicted Fe2+/Mn2+ transporter
MRRGQPDRADTSPHPTTIRIDPRVTPGSADAAELERRVEQVGSGGARAAVLGVSDGLVTNVSLILGLAGASVSASSVRLAAFASLIAGALSMAAGEWISVRSQVDLYRGVIDEIRHLVARNPQLVLHELSSRLEHAGFGRSTAQVASTELPLDEPRFMRFTARTVFGLDPDQVGSPWTAAVSSLLLFALGALMPLLPWFFTKGQPAAIWSVGVTAVASVLVGVFVARSSGRSALTGAVRQTGIVAFAAAATYGIGAAFGGVVG